MTKEFFDRGKWIAKWADNNMTKDEALKMAIEALEDSLTRQDVAINACKEALEQPAQEPVNNCPNCGSWFTKEIHSIPKPLWQELTDDEIMHIARESYMSRDGGDIKFARAIEQALKDKNT
jgi:DNA-directed RNA polymerase subunit RPC12/RpoP